MSGATATPPSTPVLRVKRRRSQSPAGALVLHLSAKKRKENEENLSPDSPKKEAVFKFTATLDAKHDHDSLKSALDRAEKLKNDPKSLKRIVKKPQKAAEKDKADKRYKIISELRGIDSAKSEEAEKESERLFKLVDVVKDDSKEMEMDEKAAKKVDEITCNGVPLVKLAEEEYVYDVYTMQSDAFSSTDSDNSFVGDFDKMDIVDISFLDCRDMDTEKDYREDFGNDSDSNDEDHWANDYPDEDEFSDDEDEAYYRDDDLDLDFEKFHIRHGNAEVASSAEESDLDEEEDLIHSRSANFERDANLHGTSYAKWKRQMLKEMGEDEEDEYDDDINEVDEF